MVKDSPENSYYGRLIGSAVSDGAIQVEYVKWHDRLPHDGCCQSHVTSF